MTTNIENNGWILNPTVATVEAVKQRCCSFCRNAHHTIPHCTSVYIQRELNQMEIRIEESIVGWINELSTLTMEGTFDANLFTDSIRVSIVSWIRNCNKSMLMAMCYRKREQLNDVYGYPHISSQMPRSGFVNILVYMYSAIITDVINFHSGTLTETFRLLVANALLAELKEKTFTEHVELDTMEYFSFMRNYLFYHKRLSQIQLLDVLLFMKNDRDFSYLFISLGEEKCTRINHVILSIQIYLDSKYNKKAIHIHIDSEWIPTDGVEDPDAVFDCSICYDTYNTQKEIQLNCGHVYCPECIFTTIETNLQKMTVPPCPLCRSDITKITIKELECYEAFQRNRPPNRFPSL